MHISLFVGAERDTNYKHWQPVIRLTVPQDQDYGKQVKYLWTGEPSQNFMEARESAMKAAKLLFNQWGFYPEQLK